MSEQKKPLDPQIEKWLIDDAQESAKLYRGMDVPRGEAYDCTLLCVNTRLGFYGCVQPADHLGFVREEVQKAIATWYGEQVRA